MPDGYAITGHLDRIVAARLKEQTDVLAVLRKIVHLEPGPEVFMFVFVTIGVMDDAGFRHLDDEHSR